MAAVASLIVPDTRQNAASMIAPTAVCPVQIRWSSQWASWTHNPPVVGSSPTRPLSESGRPPAIESAGGLVESSPGDCGLG